ncbi:low temperature requirement protein A [Lactobacillus amylovorus]|jgi:low temperature requirement protein LtrA|uniref:low temperature requirement protein A n=1 Tax=Lactobacillus amylovorus TaxID=1604 RepID=UPI001F1EE81F|nr:low temperature requirement protein A [Lactobacillus amylovorus]GMM22041.1 hypothetical protein LAYK10_13520 [Lactobacillus amylovorus]
MKKIIAKPVGMFELFYDLVFVYAISKIKAMVHHPVNGGIPLTNLLQFLFVVIVVMQIWLYQALYFNRYSQNHYFDITGFCSTCLSWFIWPTISIPNGGLHSNTLT